MSPLAAVLKRLLSRVERGRVGECPLKRFVPPAYWRGGGEAFDCVRQRRWIMHPFLGQRCGRASTLAEGLEPGEQMFEPLVMFQQHGHGDDLEGPWTRQIYSSLDMELGAVEETIKGRLIVLTQGSSKWRPGAAFGLDELAEGWKRSTHDVSPLAVGTLDGARGPCLTWASRLDKLYVATSCNSGHTNTQLNGLDQLADE